MNQQIKLSKNVVGVKEPSAAQMKQVAAMKQQAAALQGNQTAALEKAQQAEKRVRLGMDLLRASEDRLSWQTQMLQQVRAEQKLLREQIQGDVAKSLQSYDQWLGQIDESFTKAILLLEEKVDAVMVAWERKEKKLDEMVQRFERLHEQNARMMQDVKMRVAAGECEKVADGEPTISQEEVEAILTGKVVCEPTEAKEGDGLEQNDEKLEAADALADMAEQRQESVNIFSKVIREMHEHDSK